MSALAKASYFWRSATQGLRRSPFVHAIAVTTIAIALFAAGLARSAGRTVEALIASLSGEVELTVYLTPGAAEAQVEELAATLAARTGGKVERVSPDAALARLAASLGELGSALADLPDNPLPASLEVQVPPEALGAVPPLVEKMRQLPIVSDVDYGETAVARLSAIAAALRTGGLLAFAIIALATVVIVSATIQLAIYARREEIEIQKLVGGTNRFVKTPFLIEGLFQGLLGAGLALGGLWGFSVGFAPELSSLLSFLAGPGARLELVAPRLAGELLGAGALLGLCGSFVAVGRFLRV